MRTVQAWAAVRKGTRADFILVFTIRRLRQEARAAYLEMWEPHAHKEALKWVKFKKVIVSTEEEFFREVPVQNEGEHA